MLCLYLGLGGTMSHASLLFVCFSTLFNFFPFSYAVLVVIDFII